MTNPFADISDPATLRAMVQDGVKCKECTDGYVGGLSDGSFSRIDDCPACTGSGHIPLSNPDLDALAACWCEGREIQFIEADKRWRCLMLTATEDNVIWEPVPDYTTSPDAAMLLQVKYKLQPKVIELQGKEYWYVLCGAGSDDCSVVEGVTIEALCQALTEAALVAALTAAMEGDSDA